MALDMSKLSSLLSQTAEGAKAVKNFDKLSKLLNSEEGRAVLKELSGEGGDALKSAAEAASVDKDAAKSIIDNLLKAKGGPELMTKIMSILKE